MPVYIRGLRLFRNVTPANVENRGDSVEKNTCQECADKLESYGDFLPIFGDPDSCTEMILSCQFDLDVVSSGYLEWASLNTFSCLNEFKTLYIQSVSPS